MDNAVDEAVTRSARTILVISPGYVAAEWARFEVTHSSLFVIFYFLHSFLPSFLPSFLLSFFLSYLFIYVLIYCF